MTNLCHVYNCSNTYVFYYYFSKIKKKSDKQFIGDEIGSEGDKVTTYMFLVILIFGFLNPIIYYMKRNKKVVLKG